jgi:hypothetical protein
VSEIHTMGNGVWMSLWLCLLALGLSRSREEESNPPEPYWSFSGVAVYRTGIAGGLNNSAFG